MLSIVKRHISRGLYPDSSHQISMSSYSDEGVVGCYLPKALAAGFYMVESSVSGDGASGEARFFFQDKSGNQDVAFLPFQMGKLTKRVVLLRESRADIKIKLNCCSGEIKQIDFLRFVRLRKSFAVQRMHKRLAGDLGAEYNEAKLLGQDDLVAAYDRLFMPFQAGFYHRWIERVEPYLQKFKMPSQSDVYPEGYHVFCAGNYELAGNAEVIMAEALRQHPEALLVYGDEDDADPFGVRSNPHFKPGWNPDLFLSRDYISGYYLCRADWYKANHAVFERYGPRLALTRLLPGLPTGGVLHLPLILAHRQLQEAVEPGLPVESVGEQLAEREALLRELLTAEVNAEPAATDSVRIVYPVQEPVPLVSLLIPTRDGLNVLKPCVESILNKTHYTNYEILILDNQSKEQETLDWFKQMARDARVKVLTYDQPFNYSAINNFGTEHAEGSIIGLINNDVEVISPDWLSEMVSHACRPEIGCVGAKLLYSNGQVQHAGVILGLGDVAGHSHRFFERGDNGYYGRLKLVQNYSAVTAACLLVRREIYDAVGGLEEAHLTVAYNDVDFCLRVRAAGYRNLWTPYAELYHHESISRGEDDTPEKKARYDKEVAYMKARWSKELESDPCYNSNLSRRKEDFSLREFLL